MGKLFPTERRNLILGKVHYPTMLPHCTIRIEYMKFVISFCQNSLLFKKPQTSVSVLPFHKNCHECDNK